MYPWTELKAAALVQALPAVLEYWGCVDLILNTPLRNLFSMVGLMDILYYLD